MLVDKAVLLLPLDGSPDKDSLTEANHARQPRTCRALIKVLHQSAISEKTQTMAGALRIHRKFQFPFSL